MKITKKHVLVSGSVLVLAGIIAGFVFGFFLRPPDERVARELGLTRDEVQRVRKHLGLSTVSLLRMDREKVKVLIREAEHTDLARQRENFWAMLHQDEHQKIPAGALFQALQQRAVFQSKVPRNRFRVAGMPVRESPKLPPTAGLHEDNSGWTEMGPWSIGGRTRTIAIDPKNPQRLWAGSVGGGVWFTKDGGQSFAPVDDLMSNLVVSSIVIDPRDSNVVYAGTGEGFFNIDALKGAGIFRTLNGNDVNGSKWSRLPSTAGEDFSFVNRLAISPDGKTLLAATRTGIFVSNQDDRSDFTPRYRANIGDLKFHPKDSKLAVAGGMNTGNAYFSTDGGQSWNVASHDGTWIHVWEPGSDPPTSPSRVEVSYSLNDPNIVYASVDTNSGEVWRSTDGGHSYSKMSSLTSDGLSANYLGGQGWYANTIWAGDSSNSQFLLVGGLNLWKSTDGGKTLTDISSWEVDESAHADHHVIAGNAVSPKENKAVFFGNDGGLFVANDVYNVGGDDGRTSGWQRINNHYGVTQFYGLAVAADGALIAGAQDNGTLLLSKGGTPISWSEVYGGDGGFCAADPSDPKYVYGEYVNANVHRRSMAGQPAEFISGQYWDANNRHWSWKPEPYTISDAKAGSANFIAPIALDPNNSERMLVGGASLWQTTNLKAPNTLDKGPEWHAIKSSSPQFISAIAIAKSDSNVVWVGHNNGDLFVTTNGLAPVPKWTRVHGTVTKPLPARTITHITIDPSNRGIVYVTYGGYTSSNIWKTTDSGAHWTDLTALAANLPQAPVFSLTTHPSNRNFIYAGTEVGIYASEDAGTHWSPGNQGPNNSAVFEFAWSGTTLYAATHGRGVFKIELAAVPH
jgi:photosystem II stability/assembly factor-like uncharacterized protein